MPTKLEAFRAKYPRYNNLSDKDLADAIYKKFYDGKIDKEAFYDEVGYYNTAPEALGLTVTGTPARWYQSALGNAQAQVEERNQTNIQNFEDRFKEGKPAYPNMVEQLFDPRTLAKLLPGVNLEYGQGLEAQYQQLADWAASKGLKGKDQVEAALRDPANQQDLLQTMREKAAKDSLRFQLKEMQAAPVEARIRPDDALAKYGTMIAQSAIDMAPSIVAGAGVGGVAGMAASLGTMFSQVAGSKYAELRKDDPRAFNTFLKDQGFSNFQKAPELARAVSSAYGLAETIPEMVPLGKALGEGAKPFIKRLVEMFVLEPTSEVASEGAEVLIDKLMLNENMTTDQIIGRLTDAYIGGFGAATTMAATGAITDRILYGKDGNKIDAVTRPGPTVSTDFETLVEDNLDMPPNQIVDAEAGKPPLLMLPPPKKDEPFISRRHGAAPEIKEQPEPVINEQDFSTAFRDTQDRLNEQTRKDRTSLTARSAQEQLKPVHVTPAEANAGPVADLLGDKVTDIRAKRIQLGRDPDAPITLDELRAAKVPNDTIDKIKALKQPATTALRELDNQKRGLDPLEFPETVATPKLAADEPFTEEQYKSAVMAITEKGRYSFDALKSATGITSTSKMAKLKQALIDRGHLVEGKNGPVPANQMRNERATVPTDLPEGAVMAHVVRELPVGAVRVRQTKDGKTTSLGVFNTNADAQAKIASIRKGEDTKGGARSELRIEPAGKTAFGVVQKRYDKDGNFLGEAVVDSFATEAEARKSYSQNMERPPQPKGEPAPAPTPQHRVAPTKTVTGYRMLIDGVERGTYPATQEGAAQLAQDSAAAPKGSNVEVENVTGDAYQLVRDQLDADGKVIGQKIVGVHADAADAQSHADALNKMGTVRNTPPKGLEGRVDEIVAALERTAKQMNLPLLGTKIQLTNAVTTPDGQVIEGSFNPSQRLVRLSVEHFTPDMSVEEITQKLAAIIRHETIHQLRTSGLLGPETEGWKTLVNYARKSKDPKGENGETFLQRAERLYKDIPGYDSPDAIQEEAIAEAFRSWADGKVAGKPATVFKQIVAWFRRLVMNLPRDIFEDIDTGRFVADRVRSPGANNKRAVNRQRLDAAVQNLRDSTKAADENAKRMATAEYLSAREQAREDNAGRSGFKTVLGTDANKAYAEGEFMDPAQAQALAQAYRDRAGLTDVTSLPTTLQPNIDFIQKVAEAQDKAKHEPGNPAVKRAYTALTTETKAMFNSLGITVEPWRGNGQPYASAAEMGRDITANKRVKMRLTEDMFGSTPSLADHPMRQNSGIRAADGTALTNNDLFRVVHDIFGYDQIGLRPGYDADFTAYHEHARMYSPEARRAYATETLAQDAWHHFGPHLWRTDGKVALLGDPDFLPSEKKEFAQQKAFLLDDKLLASDPAYELIQRAEDQQGDIEEFDTEDTKFSIAPVNARAAMKTQGAGLTRTRKIASLENAFALTSKKKFQTGRELKLAIEKRVKDAADKAGVDLTMQNEQVLYHLVKQGVMDALYALQTNSNAIGWYNRTVREALEVMSLIHPEIKTDPEARLAFKVVLAITSNGLKVDKNFELAEAAYSAWKESRSQGRPQMPTNVGVGKARTQINQSLELFNRMMDEYGHEALERILMSPFTVGQLERIGFSINGEGVNTVVRGAAVFGPKIGNGFFANLNGKFDALTIDRWLMRTWGRWIGKLVEKDQVNIDRTLANMSGTIEVLKQDPAAFAAFEAATGVSLNGTPADVAMALTEASADPDIRDQMNIIGKQIRDPKGKLVPVGDLLRRQANSASNYLDGQIEQPSQSQRPFIRAAMDGILRVLHGQGFDALTMSDLQALLWYPEKRLYESAKGRADTSGYDDEEAPDYANAAAALARAKGFSTEAIDQARMKGRQDADREARVSPDGRTGAVEQRRGGQPEYAPTSIEEAVGRLDGGERRARARFLKRAIFVADRISRERNASPRVYRGESAGNARSLRGVKTVFKPERGFKTTLELAELPAPTIHELHATPENATAFRDLLKQSALASPYGAAVYLYDPADYQGFRLFLTEDRTGGFAIKPDGDIISVFSAGGGQVQPMLTLAIEEGGKKLDCFDTVLPDIYELNGLAEVGRDPWNDRYKPTVENGAAKDWDYETFKNFNNGRPDIVYMEVRPATAGQLTGEEARMAERLSVAPVPMTEEQRRVAARLPGGKDYGRTDLAPASVLSEPGTPAVSFNSNFDGNRYFGGDVAERQIVQARDGDQGAVLTYMSPEDFVALTGGVNPNQAVFDAAPDAGYKFNAMPSIVFEGDRGAVRVAESDGAYAARALLGKAERIPVVLYPKGKREFGQVSGLRNGDTVVPLALGFPFEYYPERRGERFSVSSEKFQKFFGDSKVVDPTGYPLRMYHSTTSSFNVFSRREADGRNGSALGTGVFYFSADPGFAEEHASSMDYETWDRNYLPGANTMPVYLSLQNPLMHKIGMPIGDELVNMAKAAGHDGIIFSTGDSPAQKFREVVVFEPTQIKSAIGNNGNWDAANPDIRYSVNTVGAKVPPDPASSPTWVIDDATEGYLTKMVSQLGKSKTNFLGTSVYDLRVKLQDRYLSLEDAIQQIRDSGGKVDDLNNVYQVQQLSEGQAFYRIEDAEAELYTPLFEAINAAVKNGISFENVETYLLAKHAPERNAFLRARKSPRANPSGMSDTDAYAFINKMRAEGKAAELESVAQLAYRITRATTAVRIEGGLISAEDALASPFKYYVPLKGIDPKYLDPDENSYRNAPRTGKGYNIGGKESRSPVGRTTTAYDIVGHLVNQHNEAILRSEKNKVAQSLARLIQDNPGNSIGIILPTVPSKLVRSSNGMVRSQPDQNYRSRPDIVTAKFNGRDVIMQISDKWVARAMRNDNVPRNGKIVQALSILNRYLATVNTGWNPNFLVTNFTRDLQTAAILANRYDIEGFAAAIVKDAPAAIAAIRKVLRTGEVEGEMAEWFDEMRRGGGTSEFLGIKTVDQIAEALRKRAASTGSASGQTMESAKAMIGGVVKFVEDYNKVAENALRLSAYANARRAGATPAQAAFIAKNLTVNFGKGGEYKVLANSLYLFYNASLSGTFVLLKGLKNKKVQRLALGIVAFGAIMDVINRLIFSGDEDDDGIKDYDEIPDYVLKNNMVFMTGGKNYIALPMPYGFNFFHNLGRNFAAAATGAPNKSFLKAGIDTLETAFDAFNPLGGSGTLLNAIMPTLADPVVDLLQNKDFAGNNIVPDRPSFDGLPVPNSQKYWNSTGQLSKDTAAFLNSISGGNETIPGWWDWSPEVIDYAINFITGAAGGFIQRNVEAVGKMATGQFDMTEDFNLLPFAPKVAGTVTTRSNVDRFYTQAEKVLLHDKQIKAAQKMGDFELAQQRAAQRPALTNLIPIFTAIDKQLTSLRKRRRAIEKSDLPIEQIRAQVKELREMEDALMRRASVEYLKGTGRAD